MRRGGIYDERYASGRPSLRFRLVLYLAGMAAIATLWGYLLFVRPPRERATAAGTPDPPTGEGATR